MAQALMVAGTLVSAMGAIREGQAKSDAAKYNAQLTERNRVVNANQTESDLIAQRRTSTKALGGMRANYSAAGVSMEGSPLDVLEESVSQSELERQNLKYNSRLRDMGMQSDANLYRANASNALQAGYTKAASTLLLGSAEAMGAGKMNRK